MSKPSLIMTRIFTRKISNTITKFSETQLMVSQLEKCLFFMGYERLLLSESKDK